MSQDTRSRRKGPASIILFGLVASCIILLVESQQPQMAEQRMFDWFKKDKKEGLGDPGFGMYPLWKFHKFDGFSLRPVPLNLEIGTGLPLPPPPLLPINPVSLSQIPYPQPQYAPPPPTVPVPLPPPQYVSIPQPQYPPPPQFTPPVVEYSTPGVAPGYGPVGGYGQPVTLGYRQVATDYGSQGSYSSEVPAFLPSSQYGASEMESSYPQLDSYTGSGDLYGSASQQQVSSYGPHDGQYPYGGMSGMQVPLEIPYQPGYLKRNYEVVAAEDLSKDKDKAQQ